MELTHNCSSPVIYAVQDDKYSRNLELSLLANGEKWIIPKDAMVLIRYCKSDGKGGEYDTLPDESTAWTAEENILTLTLAPQVLTTPGVVNLAVTLMQNQSQISTFSIIICVEASVHASIGESEEYFHVPGFLPAPILAEPGQYLQIASVDSSGHVTKVKAVTLEKSQKAIVEPMDDDIPKVFFGSELPNTKNDSIMTFHYISKTEDIRGYCKTRAQGNSSMSYPKKNQTVKLYKDAVCTEKLNVDFKGWGKQNKFCFKANWIDLTHARNIVSARLWGDVVKSRANYEALPELLRTSPNQGAVDGFPVKVYANGIYQGRYTLNIPKDAWMANMDDELDTHCILCGENYVSGCFRAEANIDEIDWTDEIHETVPESIKNRWNEAIRFVMYSTDHEFISGIGNFFDIPSLIDYYLFGLITCNNDGFGKNQLYMTYDGLQWYATTYDMDNTFGTYLGNLLAYSFGRTQFEDFNCAYETRNGNLLYIRLENLFSKELKARYEELKSGALSLTNIINRFERFTDIAPPYLVAEDYAETTANGAFTAIPLQSQSNIQQIRDYIVNRISFVDSYIKSLGDDPDLMYALPAETAFNGIDSYLDTGVTLFDKAKDFTIICDVTQGENSNNTKTVWNASGYTGGIGSTYIGAKLCFYPYESNGFCLYAVPGNSSSRASLAIPDTERVKIAVIFTAGIPSSIQYKTASGTEVKSVTMVNTDKYAYTEHTNTLKLGCTTRDDGVYTDFWNGTIHALEVYSKAMTAAEITKKLI